MTTPEFKEYLLRAVDGMQGWKDRWFAFEQDESLLVDDAAFQEAFRSFISQLSDSYPFFHPSYIGQMLKPPHPAAMIAYLATMQVNPNNHALDGGPATSRMEKEVVAEIARMIGYEQHLGHLTGGGTVANLEALWVGRELHPDTFIAFSEHSHYTHRRMCDVLRIPWVEVPADRFGSMDPEALRGILEKYPVGTVVVTLGTTGLGSVDPLHDILRLRDSHHFRIHVDAAYGGFFTLLAGDGGAVDPAPFLALPHADSVVIDPHKHGLQPYGCGCVLLRDSAVGRFYKHDSPYTYFTSDELHLGEISLECSRAGAAAAALWFTLKCLPLLPDRGFGPILRRCRQAALDWAELLRASTVLSLVTDPMLDIVAFYPRPARPTARAITALSDELFLRSMRDPVAPLYTSKYRMRSTFLQTLHPDIELDDEHATVLRCVLMKPEQQRYIPVFHREIEKLALMIREEKLPA